MTAVEADLAGETLHVSAATTADDQQRRDRQRARARANIEAHALEVHPANMAAAKALYDDLAGTLGLTDGPERVPGVCRGCGVEVPLSQRHNTGAVCAACTRRADEGNRATAPGPAPVLDPPPARPPTGRSRKVWALDTAELALLRDIFAGRVYRCEGSDWRRGGDNLHRLAGRTVHYLPPGLVRMGSGGRIYELTAAGEAQLGRVVARRG